MRKCISIEWVLFQLTKKPMWIKVLVCICAGCSPANILHANERVIKDCTPCEALFTVQQIDLNNKKVFVIDRIIKGNVNAKIMAYIQPGSRHSYSSKHLVFVVFPGVREIRSSPVNHFGRFKYEVNGKMEICSLHDLMFELDESPQAAAARLKRDKEKTNNKGNSDILNSTPQEQAPDKRPGSPKPSQGND